MTTSVATTLKTATTATTAKIVTTATTATTVETVVAANDQSQLLSPGAIAGIVVGAIALACAVILAVWLCKKRNKNAVESYSSHVDEKSSKSPVLSDAIETTPLKSSFWMLSGAVVRSESMRSRRSLRIPPVPLTNYFDVEKQAAMLSRETVTSVSSESALLADQRPIKRATLEVGLEFNVETGHLIIWVGHANNLELLNNSRDASQNGECYVKILLVTGQRADAVLLESRTADFSGSTPFINEIFTFEVDDHFKLSDVGLGLLLYDERDKIIGWLALGSVAKTVNNKRGIAHWNELKVAVIAGSDMITRTHPVEPVRTTLLSESEN